MLRYLWNSRWLLSVTAGLFLGFSFPPFPFPFLVFPAWILLFRLLELSGTVRAAAYWSYPGFVLWNLITTYWLMMAHVAAGVAAILANAVVMTLPIMLMKFFRNRYSPLESIVLLPAAWIGFEYLHHLWDLAWPWLSLGNAWSNYPEMVQYISVTGYLGISFWILAVSLLIYYAIRLSSRYFALGALAVGLLFPGVSLIQFYSVDYPSPYSVETVVVQPNFDTYEPYGGYENAEQSTQVLIDLSDSLRTDSTRLIVWPENGIRSSIYSRPTGNQTAFQIKRRLLRRAIAWKATLISGTTYFDLFDDNNEVPALPRYSGTQPYLYYNAGLGFQPDSTIQVYRKHNLVPLVERVPFVHLLNAVDLFGWIDWAGIQGYGKGREPSAIKVNDTETPPLVCYDSVFPDWVGTYVRNGAGFITVITNDGWWGETSGHIQHFSYARLRAIEFRRWVVRSANNGISGIIDSRGIVQYETDYWTRTAFRHKVPVIHRQTYYARWGAWFAWMMIGFSLGGWVLGLRWNRILGIGKEDQDFR